MTAEASIVGVHIPAYKNLADVWLPWSPGLSLVGQNGAGKTNVLEALALLMGTEETLRLCGDRLATPSAEGLSVVVRDDGNALPVGPSTLADADLGSLGPEFEQLQHDLDWWLTEGIREGGTFADALGAWILPEDLRRIFLAAARSSIVQYTLLGVDHQPGKQVRRLFRRTLLTDLPLRGGPAPSSPAFSPLGAAVAAPGMIALLELPLSSRPPAVVQWLPRLRTEDEVIESLQRAFAEALDPVEEFVGDLAERLPSNVALDPVDGHWWLHKFAESVGNSELKRTAPGLFIESEGGGNADWALGVVSEDSRRETMGHSLERPLENFSSGQRRWLDEALATMGLALRNRGDRAHIFRAGLTGVDDLSLIDHVLAGTGIAETEGYWPAEALDSIMSSLERTLIANASADLPTSPGRRAMVRAVMPYYAQLDQQIVIRVLDEPEAHLHVTAQRQVAAAVQTLRNEGQNIVLATHSPAFLEFPEWQTVHISNGHLTVVTPMDDINRHRLSQDLGLTLGELLAGVATVLVVEGPHDQLVLDKLYGAELRQAGIAIVRMFGTNNLLDLMDLDFIERYVDAPIAVMLDYTKTELVHANKPRTDEEHKLLDLKRAAKKKGMSFDVIGLQRPDIVCYLNEEAIRRGSPNFPGWAHVLRGFEDIRLRPSFKPWLRQDYGVDLTNSGRIREVLEIMTSEHLPPAAEFHHRISEFLAGRR